MAKEVMLRSQITKSATIIKRHPRKTQFTIIHKFLFYEYIRKLHKWK